MAYVPTTFACPNCQAPLRLRQRPMGLQRLPCPDCGQPLVLSDQAGDLLVRPAEPAPPKGRSQAARGARAARGVAVRTAVSKPFLNPLVVIWLAAGIAALTLAVAFLRTGRDTRPEIVASARTNESAGASDPQPSPPVGTSPEDVPKALEEPSEEAKNEIADVPEPAETVVEHLPPAEAPRPPASPPVDPREEIAARLAQRVLRFEQTEPAPFDMLRMQIEDLAGVPIRYDEAITSDAARLGQTPVRLRLTDVTLDEVLGEAARQAELAHVIDPNGVRLVPAADRLQANRTSAGSPSVP